MAGQRGLACPRSSKGGGRGGTGNSKWADVSRRGLIRS